MCNVLDGSRLMYVYCETIEETQGEEVTVSQYASPNTTQDLEFEKQQLLDIFNLEGIPEDMYDIYHLLSKPICDEQTSEVSDNANISFHEDNSNIDSTDEDVRSHKAKMVDVPIETLNWNIEVVDSDFSDCIDSDEERMKSQRQQSGPSKNAPVTSDALVTSDAPMTSEAPTQGSSAPRPRKKNKKNQSFPTENPSDYCQGGATRSASVGGIVKKNGRWVRGLGGYIGLADPVTAELWAIYYGLKMAWERNKTNLVVFSECREAITIIRNDDPSYPMAMLVDMI
ncbi:hypothetical protein POM88_029250 [Heracleum sosnowskyi]|uniref:RNase H type-1 domain-containing protein n=1 Tax=Heracleum sosnowskyi TaxID=360622 RepID=A0AAD8HTA2_9APIA|nr:hypothetical protein POM88_029250 [Heracleum sosnowskyi]